MSENFGPNQPRVLDAIDRNIDNVVFQHRRPLLTSEFNLLNQIGSLKTQNALKVSYPSGWLNVEDITQDQDELYARGGQAICSYDYTQNTFKLMSFGDNIAIVNGWPILVQGSNSTGNENNILLEDPLVQKYDFVFLEVWRKLIGKDDPLYPYGNVLKSPYSDNQIYYSAIGIETTERVQIQYRIRVNTISTELTAYDDIFDVVDVHPIGGRTTGEYGFKSFAKYGASDIGLYVAGDGSSSDQTALQTVDGYVYAIPMFLVYRRIPSSGYFGPTTMGVSYTDKDMYDDGYRSDRPDGKLRNVIYKDDILDLRHQVVTAGSDVQSLLTKTTSKLLAGELSTALKKGFDNDGALSPAYAGISTLLKVERVNSVGGDNIPNVGTGSSTSAKAFKRRAFCNAEYTADHNIVELKHTGAWTAGTHTDAFDDFNPPDGEVVSADGFYNTTVGALDGVTVSIVDGVPVSVSIAYGSTAIGQTQLIMEYTFKYHSSTSGFKDVPKHLVEVNKGTKLPIATRDADIPVRFNNAGDLLNFGAPVNYGETNALDHVHYAGGNYTDNYSFGHELVVYRTTNGSSIVPLSLTDSKLNGYYVLGVKTVELTSALGVPVAFTQQRNVTSGPPYVINSYTITVSGHASTDVRITLYTGSKFLNSYGDAYSEADSFKFFEMSKQGRGVVDTYEMIEVISNRITFGAYTNWYSIDTGDKPIIAFMTKTDTVSGITEGTPFVFDNDGAFCSITTPSSINNKFPILSQSEYVSSELLPTKVMVQVTTLSGPLPDKIRIPVLVHSYVTSTEISYNFYYHFKAYQGILSSATSFYGSFKEEGIGLLTTSGSGAITDYRYDEGTVSTVETSRTVTGVGTLWSKYVKAGDWFRVDGSSKYYVILSVGTDTSLTLREAMVEASETGHAYEITRPDVCRNGIRNIVDRLPTYKINSTDETDATEFRCYSDEMEFGEYTSDIYKHKPLAKLHDPINAYTNDFVLGAASAAKRGRNNILLTTTENDAYPIVDAQRPYLKYVGILDELADGHHKKCYQFYVFNRSARGYTSGAGLTGRLYLAVIAGEVDSSTENSLNPFFQIDTVDVYEMVGRPVLKGH